MFRKIADLKRERELAETRKNEGLDQISSDHPVRKLISKFRKISQESRAASQNSPIPPATATTATNSTPSQAPSIPVTTVQPPSAEPIDGPPTVGTPTSLSTAAQLLQLPLSSTSKQRDKLETISERIETQESQVSQITSVNQSPPLQRPPKSSKWKWLKTGSTEPEIDSSSKAESSTLKPSVAPQPQQQTTNPFDTNLSDDDCQTKTPSVSERRPSIPLSLFIPRSARRGSARTSDEGGEDQVSRCHQ